MDNDETAPCQAGALSTSGTHDVKRVPWIFISGRKTSVDGQIHDRIHAALVTRSGDNVDAAKMAASVAMLCEEIGQALAPIVGQGGVAALYKRSLFLTAREHAVLFGLHADVQGVMNVSALTSQLTSLSQPDAARVGAALFCPSTSCSAAWWDRRSRSDCCVRCGLAR